SRLEESVAIWRRVGERLQLGFDLVWLAFAYGRAGRWEEAEATGTEALRLFRAADNPTGIGIALTDLSFLATWQGRHEDAMRLGLYRALAEGGPATSTELAWRTGTAERYVREWLEHQAVAGLVGVEDPSAPASERRYSMPAEHLDVLVDRDSILFSAHKGIDI